MRYAAAEAVCAAAAAAALLHARKFVTLPCPAALRACATNRSAGRGSRARPSKQPAQPLTLWGYELSPFVKVVQEVLSELELPYNQVRRRRCTPPGLLGQPCCVAQLSAHAHPRAACCAGDGVARQPQAPAAA